MIILKQGSKGPQVSMIQLALLRAGYSLRGNNKGIDGYFGSSTYAAILAFQRDNNLIKDGIVGMATFKKLLPYITGFFRYRIQPGDTFYKISRKYGVSSQAISVANPQVSPTNMPVGALLNVPIGFYNGDNYVSYGEIPYTWELLSFFIEGIMARYPFVNLSTIGTSELGRGLFCLAVGTGDSDVMFNASHHANESITTPVVLRYIEKFAYAYAFGGEIGGFSASDLYEQHKLFVVPMVNPDGVDLVNGYFFDDSLVYRNAFRLSSAYPDIPFPSGWKANITGVDLNLNYPAGWELAREIKFSQGYTSPGPRDFVGASPLCASESAAMAAFTASNNFDLSLSFHTQGNVIFWKYLDYNPPRSFEIGELLSKASGYSLELTPALSGYAGYKDWFIQDFNRPSYTIECGLGVNPLSVSQFDRIYVANEPLMSVALSEAGKQPPL